MKPAPWGGGALVGAGKPPGPGAPGGTKAGAGTGKPPGGPAIWPGAMGGGKPFFFAYSSASVLRGHASQS